MELRKYEENDADIILSWINDERSFRLWSADRYADFPIKPVDINNNYNECMKNGKFYPLTLVDNENVIGHLIIRYPDDKKDSVRLGFIIVDNTKRGMGYGKKLILEAISYAKEKLDAKEITLGVFSVNQNALKCYESVGFETIYIEKNAYKFHEEEWDCNEMVLKKR